MTSRTGDRGLTLVEVLLSVVLLATAAVFVLQGLAGISRAMTIAESRNTAYAFSLSKMAELEIAARRGRLPMEQPEHGSFREGRQPYAWTVTAAAVPEHPELASLEMAVHWRQGRDDRALRIETVVSAKPETATSSP
ncbi:MAG: prepilin-type N-terminal cleavage/methylation domain-containing protein [Candidatus Omnitrophica bacterium]|nr:prepilin-type N-terminal cleavage/methylation domain-containing protein [Candidatus Omnitrophota bacterium]